MRIKSFTAPTMAEVMEQVKAALGEDAIIVTTKEDAAAGVFRVTAALDDGGDDGYETLEPNKEPDAVLQDASEAGDYIDEPWDGDTQPDDDEDPPDLDGMLLTPEALAGVDEKGAGTAVPPSSAKPASSTKKRPTTSAEPAAASRPRPLPDWVRAHEEPEFIHQLADSAYSLLIDHGTPRRLARVGVLLAFIGVFAWTLLAVFGA